MTSSEARGTITAAGQTVSVNVGDDHSSWLVYVSGNFSGILRTEAAFPGLNPIPIASRASNGGALGNAITRAGLYRGNAATLPRFQVRAEAGFSGLAEVVVRTAPGVGAVFPNTFQVAQRAEQYYASTSGGNTLFDATTGEQTLSTSGGPIALLRNPANSGVDLYIDRINYGTNGNGVFRRYRGATITTTGAIVAPGNRGGGENAAVGLFSTLPNLAVSSPGALRRTSYVAAFAESRNDVDGSLILRPGQNFYWTYTPQGNNANSATVEVIWWEAGALV